MAGLASFKKEAIALKALEDAGKMDVFFEKLLNELVWPQMTFVRSVMMYLEECDYLQVSSALPWPPLK